MKKRIAAIILCSFICAAFTGCIQDNLENQSSIPEKTIVSAYEEQSETTAAESSVQGSTLTSAESNDSSDTNSKASKKSEASENSDKTSSSKNSSKSESKTVSQKSSTQSTETSKKQPDISYEVSEKSTPGKHSNISAEVSGNSQTHNSGKKVYGISVEIADNDPHKDEKIKIVELIKEILSDHSINYLSDLSIILDRKFESTGVKFYTDLPTITSISGEFEDGTKWKVSFSQIYMDDSLSYRAKRSSDESENQYLDNILNAARNEIAKQNNGDPVSEETILNINDIIFKMWQDDNNMIDVNVRYDGIEGTFADGTEWGYTFEELR